MVDFDFRTQCYSCSACGQVCPTKAIRFDEALHPVIDREKCINCRICEKVCVNINEEVYLDRIDNAESYVARNIDNDIRMKSSSGGIFYSLAKAIVEKGGVVCGCIYDEDFMPKHVMTNEMSIVRKMMGSKYVLSNMEDIICQIKRELNNGRPVLFSGVPCQIQAVTNCIIDRTNLFLVSVVCHGSIERCIWKRYINEETHGRTIDNITMRDKAKGWLNYGLRFQFTDGSESVSYRYEDGYFLKCYTDGLFERRRCLNCKYKGTRIGSDILLGDAWGMDKFFPEMTDSYGLSSVICLTKKGRRLFETINENIERKPINTSSIIEYNKRIISPPIENPLLRKFSREIKKNNLHSLCKKYAAPTLLFSIFGRMIKKMNAVIRRAHV